METLTARVQKALRKEFSPREIRLNHVGQGKYSGWIISKSFDKLNDNERYQKVRKLIEASLTEKDRERILGFFLFTPLEERMIVDENFDVLEMNKKQVSTTRKKTAVASHKDGRTATKRR